MRLFLGGLFFLGLAVSASAAIEGYGKNATGGAGKPTCTVTTGMNECLQPGDVVTNKIIQFANSTVTGPIANARIGSNVTIDGCLNGQNGVTINQPSDIHRQLSIEGPATNVIIRCIRFAGTGIVNGSSVEFDLLNIDGTGGAVSNVAIERNTFINASDGALDITGNVTDVTVQYNLFYGTSLNQLIKYNSRARISLHHNVYTENGERNPQIKGDAQDIDFVSNIVYNQTITTDGVGSSFDPYGTKIWNGNSGSDSFGNVKINMRANFYGGVNSPIEITTDAGASAANVYIGPDNVCGRPGCPTSPAGLPYTIPGANVITATLPADMRVSMLPLVGAPNRTAGDTTKLDAVSLALPGEGRYYNLAAYTTASNTGVIGMGIAPCDTQNWYVSLTGSDTTGNGSLALPYRTITKAITRTLPAGACVLIHTGIYHEKLRIGPASSNAATTQGTEALPVVIGPYGDGVVTLDASPVYTGWVNVSGSIWSINIPSSFGIEIAPVANEVALMPACNYHNPAANQWNCDVSNLTQAGDYAYSSATKTLYVWLPDSGNPNLEDVFVPVNDQYTDGGVVAEGNYVILYGMTFRGAGGHGMVFGNGPVTNPTARNNRFIFNGKAGLLLQAVVSPPQWVPGAKVLYNEFYFNSQINWPEGRYKFGLWAQGLTSAGTNNLLYQGNVAHRNHGEGIGAYGGKGIGGVGGIVRENMSYDNWSAQFYVVQNHMIIERNLAYCDYDRDFFASARNNGESCTFCNTNPTASTTTDCVPSPSTLCDWKVRRRQIGNSVGMGFAEEQLEANMHDSEIRNNVVINCLPAMYFSRDVSVGVVVNMKFYNNTLIQNKNVPANVLAGQDIRNSPNFDGTFLTQFKRFGNDPNYGNEFRNNIIYGFDTHVQLMHADDVTRTAADFDVRAAGTSPPEGIGIPRYLFSNNLWYHANRSTAMEWGTSASHVYTHAGWCALAGLAHCTGDIDVAPDVVNLTTWEGFAAAVDKALNTTSPAKNAGVVIASVVDDFLSNARDVTPDIGAFEFGGTTVTVPLATTLMPGPLPSCIKDLPCNFSFGATGGTPPYTWTKSAGTLCTGMALSTSGNYAGTPTVGQTCSFTARVTDAVLATATVAVTQTITVPVVLHPTFLSINAGSVDATASFGRAGLPKETPCTLTIGGDVDQVFNSTSGPSTREEYLSPLLPNTTKIATAVCSGYSDPTSLTFRTLPLGDPAGVVWTLSARPSAVQVAQGVTKLNVWYWPKGQDPDPSFTNVIQATVACASGCTTTVTLGAGISYNAQRFWLNDAFDTLAASTPRVINVP